MKILVCPGDDGACAFYRAYSPYWKLGPGYEVAFTYDPDDENFKTADVLVIPRIHTELALDVFKKFAASGRPTILDFDDLFHGVPWYNPAKHVFYPGSEDLARFEEALDIATLVTVSTQPLADAYKDRRDDIMVCPNFITNEHLDEVAPQEITGEPKMEGMIRIGYVGSHTHFGDVALLARPLSEIAEAYPQVRYVFFGYPPVLPLQHRLNSEYYPGIGRASTESVSEFMLRYYNEIKAMKIDIALAPLEDSLFNRCKSNIKLLEYGIAGVPTLASNVEPYYRYAQDGLGVGMVFGQDEWFTKLSLLVKKPDIRKQVADTNVGKIRERHTTRAAIGAWHAVLSRLELGASPSRSPESTGASA